MAKFKLPVIVKDKNANMAIYVGILAVIGYLVYKNWDKIKTFLKIGTPTTTTNDVDKKSDENKKSTATTATGEKITIDNNTILKKGMEGDRVQWLQSHFNKYVAPVKKATKLVEDGKFGTNTENAVKSVLSKTTTSWTEWKTHVESKYKTQSTTTTTNTNTSTPKNLMVLTNSTPLHLGVSGDRVQWVQHYYNAQVAPKKGYAKIQESGTFDKATETAVKNVVGKTSTTWETFKIAVDYDMTIYK